MYISDIDKPAFRAPTGRTLAVYLILSAAAALIAQVYGLFGHGVTSPAMTFMFLYPLLGGFGLMLCLRWFQGAPRSQARFRLFANLYNAGIATFAAGSLLQGIFEIAGTSSPYTVGFYALGCALCLAGLGILQRKR